MVKFIGKTIIDSTPEMADTILFRFSDETYGLVSVSIQSEIWSLLFNNKQDLINHITKTYDQFDNIDVPNNW